MEAYLVICFNRYFLKLSRFMQEQIGDVLKEKEEPFQGASSHLIDEGMLRLLDPNLQSLVNVNTPHELAVYQVI